MKQDQVVKQAEVTPLLVSHYARLHLSLLRAMFQNPHNITTLVV